jgi:hypothetical protein
MRGMLEEFEQGKGNTKIITLMAAETLNQIQRELENELEDWGHLIPNETVDCLNKAKELISQAISKIHGFQFFYEFLPLNSHSLFNTLPASSCLSHPE